MLNAIDFMARPVPAAWQPFKDCPLAPGSCAFGDPKRELMVVVGIIREGDETLLIASVAKVGLPFNATVEEQQAALSELLPGIPMERYVRSEEEENEARMEGRRLAQELVGAPILFPVPRSYSYVHRLTDQMCQGR